MKKICEGCRHKPKHETVETSKRMGIILRCQQCIHGEIYQDLFEPVEPVVLSVDEFIRIAKAEKVNKNPLGGVFQWSENDLRKCAEIFQQNGRLERDLELKQTVNDYWYLIELITTYSKVEYQGELSYDAKIGIDWLQKRINYLKNLKPLNKD